MAYEIACDYCGEKVNLVAVEPVAPFGWVSMSVAGGSHVFCGLVCVSKWINERLEKNPH